LIIVKEYEELARRLIHGSMWAAISINKKKAVLGFFVYIFRVIV